MARKAIYDSTALQTGADANYTVAGDTYDSTPVKIAPSLGLLRNGPARPRRQQAAQYLNWLLNQFAQVCLGLIDHTAELEAADTAVTTAFQTADAALGDLLVMAPPGLRLTTVSSTPVADGISSTLYYTPYASNLIALYDGTQWRTRKTAEISIAVPAAPPGLAPPKTYDVFAYWTGAAVALEYSLFWTDETVRQTTLARQDGVLVKASDHTRRLVGTIRRTSTQDLQDNLTHRNVFNQYNRVLRQMMSHEISGDATWVCPITTWRTANAQGTSLSFVLGEETQVNAWVLANVSALDVTPLAYAASVGIGLDTVTDVVNIADAFGGSAIDGAILQLRAEYSGLIAAGGHHLTWLEAAGQQVVFFSVPTEVLNHTSAIKAQILM